MKPYKHAAAACRAGLSLTGTLLFLSFLLYSCSPVLYSNVGHNVPLFKEKGDFAAGIGYTTDEIGGMEAADGVSFSGAYALSDHWLAATSVYTMWNNDADNDFNGKGTYFDLGAGYYGTAANNKLVYEIQGGIGFGRIKNTGNKDYSGQHAHVTFSKPYIQPAIGFSGKYFEAAFTPRIAYLTYGSADYKINDPNNRSEYNNYISESGKKLYFEPGITIRGGWPNIKAQLQYAHSTIDDRYAIADLFSLGVVFKFNTKRTQPAGSDIGMK